MIILYLSDKPDSPPGENSPHRVNKWPESLWGHATNDQEMAQREADIQGLNRSTIKDFPPEVIRYKAEVCIHKGEHLKASVKYFV